MNRDIQKLSIHERGRLAGEMAIEDVIDRHRRAGLPIAIVKDGKAVEVSVDEYVALRNARKAAKAAANGAAHTEGNGSPAP